MGAEENAFEAARAGLRNLGPQLVRLCMYKHTNEHCEPLYSIVLWGEKCQLSALPESDIAITVEWIVVKFCVDSANEST